MVSQYNIKWVWMITLLIRMINKSYNVDRLLWYGQKYTSGQYEENIF